MKIIVFIATFLGWVSLMGQTTFQERFEMEPDRPTSFIENENWAFFLHSRDKETQYTPYPSVADHGPNCEPPVHMEVGDNYDTTHVVNSYEDMVYVCRNHLMTNLRSDGYGLINLMPNQLVDFSEQEAIIRWDVSTLNQSAQNRDWFTIAVMPFENLNPLHAPDWAPDLEGLARNMIRLETTWINGSRGFALELTDQNFNKIELPIASFKSLEELITPSKVIRSTFELRISKNRLKFGLVLPENHPSGEVVHWWVDTESDMDGNPITLGWKKGVVLLGHYSYNPRKNGGLENTWHWDNLFISPAQAFTIIGTDKRFADENEPTLIFNQAAPENAQLLFSATDYLRISDQMELSFDGGENWLHADRIVASITDLDDSWGSSYVPYRISIPAGTQSVIFRGQNSEQQQWMARDLYIVQDQDLSTSLKNLKKRKFAKRKFLCALSDQYSGWYAIRNF